MRMRMIQLLPTGTAATSLLLAHDDDAGDDNCCVFDDSDCKLVRM